MISRRIVCTGGRAGGGGGDGDGERACFVDLGLTPDVVFSAAALEDGLFFFPFSFVADRDFGRTTSGADDDDDELPRSTGVMWEPWWESSESSTSMGV